MITDNNINYNQDDSNFSERTQSYIDQYQQKNSDKENDSEQGHFLSQNEDSVDSEDSTYLDDEFSNALERDDQEDLEEDLEEDDLEEDDLENDHEPETFADDSLKID